MAKIELLTHPKWRRLRSLLPSTPEAHLLGHFEMLLHSCYSKCNPDFTDAEDVELSAGWVGDAGALATALVKSGFLDELTTAGLRVHDWVAHTPRSVARRRAVHEWAETAGVELPASAHRGGRSNSPRPKIGLPPDGHRTDSERPPDGHRTDSERPVAPYPDPDPDPDPKILRDDVGDDAPRPTKKKTNKSKRRKPKPENQEAQRLIALYRGAVHQKRGITPGATMGKDTARVAAKMVKARPAIENESIVLAFAESPPKINGSEVTQNIGALLGFAEAAAATPTYRELLKFLETDEGRAAVDDLVEHGRSLKGVAS